MARRRILIVDDDERVLFVLHHALVRLSREYDVMTARNAHEALDEIKKMPFDLVISDLKMRGMDGVELTEAVRTLSPSTIVVWITAYGGEQTDAEAQRLGVYRCLDKPVEVDEIRQVVREALTSEKQDGMEGAPK
jgi:DNA-binding NtrC family response regulator